MISTGRLFRSLLLLSTLLVSFTQAQRDDSRFDFYARGPYREMVPRPQSLLRYDVGEFHTNYAMMERVLEKIAQAAPDRVRVIEIGETNERRTMRLVAVSSPENIRRLDEIKANIARLADPRKTSAAEAQSIIGSTPVVVWLAYTIHGNESASFEAMMQVLYQLAASNEAATQEILQNCVVLINVCENPDGHERFVSWYNANATGNPDPLAGEHREPWSVFGRYNRYRFDLNRDNIASTQTETRLMQRAYLEWNPQVFVDHHGQPAQFFFPPAAQPVNPNLPPGETAQWLTIFGRANAEQFDARNWDFYVRDVFDLFYPGYWDSWPSLNGATGMTYETDGGGYKGINYRRDDDTIITLRSGIAKHFVASMTTLDTAAKFRQARLKDYYNFKQSAIEEGRNGRMKRIILLAGRDAGNVNALVQVLLRAGIEVSVAREPFGSQSAHSYAGGERLASREFPAGSYVIDLAQPQKRLAKALLEPETVQDAAFVREQLARFARNERRGRGASKEDYGFYDITAWSLPLAFGVEAYWTEDAGNVRRDAVSLADSLNLNMGGVQGGRAQVAYIIPYDNNAAPALAYRLQREGFRIAVSTRTLSAGGRTWPRGTIVVRVSRNSERLHDAIARLSRETGAPVWSVNTGFYETGETGVGSGDVVALSLPRIIVVADEGVDHTSYGAIWWMFDQAGVEFTPMTIANLRRAALDRYNVIIIPDGSADRYFSAFGKGGIESLRGWVQRGGTLICIKGAAVFAALKDVNLTSSRLVGSEEDEQKGKDEAEARPQTPPASQAEESGSAQSANQKDKGRKGQTQNGQAGAKEEEQTEKLEGAPPELPPIASPSARPGVVPEAVPGAIMRATVDRTTYLTYGYEEQQLAVLVNSGYFFRPSKEGTNAVVFSPDERQGLRISGYVWPNTEKLLRGTAYVMDEPTGRGHVILFAEEPSFRGIWRTTTRLFFNSILFPSAM
ncbi:MAG TPA: M14 family zinc carboxypeptidase [Pyrinomonadaceae bacterium]